jgi:hypothetical protein
MKKDARLTIRIPKELKTRIDEIHRVYGVALPKIANESLKAFCEYVEERKQTPTFPLLVAPHSHTGEKSGRALAGGRRGITNRRRQRK